MRGLGNTLGRRAGDADDLCERLGRLVEGCSQRLELAGQRGGGARGQVAIAQVLCVREELLERTRYAAHRAADDQDRERHGGENDEHEEKSAASGVIAQVDRLLALACGLELGEAVQVIENGADERSVTAASARPSAWRTWARENRTSSWESLASTSARSATSTAV